MLDRATQWLVARGRTDQWGTEPHSADPRRVARVTGYAESGGLWIAELDDRPVGALAVGAALPYVPAATVPELYVRLLITERAYAGRGIGSALLDHARALARQQGVAVLRVDCFAGGDGALVRYYESQGFTRTATFTVDTPRGPWPGQVLALSP
ncbi:GNAT family N-acetyltransferase [Actinomycetes bacterium KLBMP 9797]